MKHCFILGTRPEIIKLYSCLKYAEQNNLDYFVIHSNQHYSTNMDKVFFDELKLSEAKYNLGINGGNHGEMTGKMMIEIEKILLNEKPDIVYVQGDTNTVLAGGLVASKLGIKVAHIEAGLRSYDKSMPEEINRICTDHLSDFLFSPALRQKEILLKENIDENKIFVVGNTVVDAVYMIKELSKSQTNKVLDKYKIKENDYILLTSHRPSNVDNKENIENILKALIELSNISAKKILFPIHPRTKNNIIKFGLEGLLDSFIVIEPVGFFDNIILESNAYFIATDSGGIQEEACILQKRTLILRENTERPETLEVGGAILVGNNKEKIIQAFRELEKKDINWYNPFGDGKSAEKIFDLSRLK
ncbi:MAG: UDP-N-acetylglucosamine 2-epimerase (non-hydrolyzing) [Candidatus Gracilibacteria bacterium]|nr:UDP-N-acetylglucosamine 2-epimerase (non-hydrolyzing) [Candidatus Gracilibacteria bacterium]